MQFAKFLTEFRQRSKAAAQAKMAAAITAVAGQNGNKPVVLLQQPLAPERPAEVVVFGRRKSR